MKLLTAKGNVMRLTKLLFLLFPITCFADQYLCMSDSATGFTYNDITGEWQTSTFSVRDSKYVITESKEDNYAFKVAMHGTTYSYADCKDDFNEYGYLVCSGAAGTFKFNRINGRFLKTYELGYYNVLPKIRGNDDTTSDTPTIEIGKCTPL